MFFSPRSDQKIIMLLEVQSCLVRGSLMLIEKPDASAAHLSTREGVVEYRSGDTSAKYAEAMIKRISEVAEILCQDLSSISTLKKSIPRYISEVHYVLSSPWVISRAKTIRVDFDKDTRITSEKLSKILEEERLSSAKNITDKTQAIEEKVFDVRLNGYAVSDWKGKEARTLEVSYAISLGSENSIARLKRCVERMARSGSISFHSSLLLQYISLRGAQSHSHYYMLIHVHGEITDIVMVRNGMCSFFGSYPVGIHTIVKSLGHMNHSDRHVTESLLSLYLEKRMDVVETEKTKKMIDRASENWVKGLKTLIGSVQSVPPKILVISQVHSNLFKTQLESFCTNSHIGQISVDMPAAYSNAISSLATDK